MSPPYRELDLGKVWPRHGEREVAIACRRDPRPWTRHVPYWLRHVPGESLATRILRVPVMPVVAFAWLSPLARRAPALRDSLVRAASTVIGSPDHVQVAGLVAAARAYRLDEYATAALSLTVEGRLSTVEENLDLVSVPPGGVWIEWPEHARKRGDLRPGAVHPVTSGALVVPWAGHPEAFAIITGWMLPDGSVRHSHALAFLHSGMLASHAAMSRQRWDSAEPLVRERMGRTFAIHFPPGLAGEIESLGRIGNGSVDRRGNLVEADLDGEALAAARDAAALNVSVDVPFIQAALVLLASRSAVLSPGQAMDVLSCLPHRPNLADRARAALGRRARDGFVRGRGTRLVPPAGPTAVSSAARA